MFILRFIRWCLTGLSFALILIVHNANAFYEFDGLERFGGVRVEGHLEYQDYDYARLVTRTDGIGFHNAGLDPLNHSIDLEDLDLQLPYVSAEATGQAKQYSLYDGTTLYFQAANNITITGNAGIGALFGSAMARSSFQATFLINVDTLIDLTMSSNVDPGLGEFTFSLANNAGFTAWDRTSVLTPDGQNLHSFSQRLTLTPGFYTLNATLKALGGLDPTSIGTVSTPTAMFSMSAIPESNALFMVGGGLLVVLYSRRKGARMDG